MQWRELRATAGRACGSTLRRRLDEWSATALLRQVHVALIRMVRAGPEVAAWDVVVDSRSVRAKRGGELTGPNPTDRGKAGTKYHVVASTDGLPLGVVPSAANVHDTRLFPHLLRLARVVCAAIGRLYADAGYDSAENRGLCLRDGIQPHIRELVGTVGRRGFVVEPRRWKVIACTELPNRGSSGPRRSSEGGCARWAMTTAVRG